MKNIGLWIATVLAFPTAMSTRSRANEVFIPIAVSGDWATYIHRNSITSPNDICAAANENEGFILWESNQRFEIRIMDPDWSMPSDVHGDIVLKIGPRSFQYPVSSNTDSMIAAEVPHFSMAVLTYSMDKFASMSLVVGNLTPKTISLSRITKVTNAFRICAGIYSPPSDPDADPFDNKMSLDDKNSLNKKSGARK